MRTKVYHVECKKCTDKKKIKDTEFCQWGQGGKRLVKPKGKMRECKLIRKTMKTT